MRRLRASNVLFRAVAHEHVVCPGDLRQSDIATSLTISFVPVIVSAFLLDIVFTERTVVK